MRRQITVPADQDGWRLDRVLAGDIGSRQRARAAVEAGQVAVGGVTVTDAARRVQAGATVELDTARRPVGVVRRRLARAGLPVLYEDDAIIVIDKPAGLLTDTATHAQRRTRDSVRALASEALHQRVIIVHRIDRDTSGVVVLARTQAAADALFGQFRERSPGRIYRALVWGVPRPARGEWEDWMRWERRARRQEACAAGAEGALLARSRYRVLRRFGRHASELEVRLETGRRNQIRLQAALRGHPLVGERQYRPSESKDARTVRAARQALHAASLQIVHPITGAPLTVEAPTPADLRKLAAELERRWGATILAP